MAEGNGQVQGNGNGAARPGSPLTFTKKDFTSDQEVRWCPGCGDYAILAAVQSFMPSLGVEPHNTVFISGIGCSEVGRRLRNTDAAGHVDENVVLPQLEGGPLLEHRDQHVQPVDVDPVGDPPRRVVGGDLVDQALDLDQ